MHNITGRDLALWLQYMDLSYTFTNYHRHFSNGYLIADILNKLHPNKIYLESFENVSKSESKYHNWQFIRQRMRKTDMKFVYLEKNSFFEDIIRCTKTGEKNIIMLLKYLMKEWKRTKEE